MHILKLPYELRVELLEACSNTSCSSFIGLASLNREFYRIYLEDFKSESKYEDTLVNILEAECGAHGTPILAALALGILPAGKKNMYLSNVEYAIGVVKNYKFVFRDPHFYEYMDLEHVKASIRSHLQVLQVVEFCKYTLRRLPYTGLPMDLTDQNWINGIYTTWLCDFVHASCALRDQLVSGTVSENSQINWAWSLVLRRPDYRDEKTSNLSKKKDFEIPAKIALFLDIALQMLVEYRFPECVDLYGWQYGDDPRGEKDKITRKRGWTEYQREYAVAEFSSELAGRRAYSNLMGLWKDDKLPNKWQRNWEKCLDSSETEPESDTESESDY